MKRLLFVALSFTLLFASCVKKPAEAPVGEAKVRFVNAAIGTESQDLYINAGLVVTSPLGYRGSSPYFGYLSGFNVFAFANTGTQVATSSVDYASAIGSNSTIFQYRNLNGLIVSDPIPDDTSAPAAGKFKVRFVHLNHFLNNSMKVAVTGGSDLFAALNFRAASAYYEVDPGTKFTASATGVTNAPEIVINATAGKVYTIWFSGEDEKQLIPNLLIHN